MRHVKDDREHYHVVWSRIDIEERRAIPDSHNYRKHEEVARQLEREFGHERVQGALTEREGVPRPARTPSRAEIHQAERSGLDPAEIKAEVTALWQATDNGKAFAAALEEAGYQLARGDRRDFVILDQAGEVHSLARRVEGAKAKDVRERMADLDPANMPDVTQARAMQAERAAALVVEPERPVEAPPATNEPPPDRAALLAALLERPAPASPRVQPEAERPLEVQSPAEASEPPPDREALLAALLQSPATEKPPAQPELVPPPAAPEAPAAPFTIEQREAEARALEQARVKTAEELREAELAAALQRRKALAAEIERIREYDPRIAEEEAALARGQAQRDERERKSLRINHQHQWRNLEELEKTRAFNDRIADDRLAEIRAREDAELARKNGGIIGWIKGLFNPSLVREREAEKERIAEQRQHEDARRLSERRERDALARVMLTEAQEQDRQRAERARQARREMEQEQQHERQCEREAREIEEAIRAREGREDDERDWEPEMGM